MIRRAEKRFIYHQRHESTLENAPNSHDSIVYCDLGRQLFLNHEEKINWVLLSVFKGSWYRKGSNYHRAHENTPGNAPKYMKTRVSVF